MLSAQLLAKLKMLFFDIDPPNTSAHSYGRSCSLNFFMGLYLRIAV